MSVHLPKTRFNSAQSRKISKALAERAPQQVTIQSLQFAGRDGEKSGWFKGIIALGLAMMGFGQVRPYLPSTPSFQSQTSNYIPATTPPDLKDSVVTITQQLHPDAMERLEDLEKSKLEHKLFPTQPLWTSFHHTGTMTVIEAGKTIEVTFDASIAMTNGLTQTKDLMRSAIHQVCARHTMTEIEALSDDQLQDEIKEAYRHLVTKQVIEPCLAKLIKVIYTHNPDFQTTDSQNEKWNLFILGETSAPKTIGELLNSLSLNATDFNSVTLKSSIPLSEQPASATPPQNLLPDEKAATP